MLLDAFGVLNVGSQLVPGITEVTEEMIPSGIKNTMTSLDIPEGVVVIEESAFADFARLYQINLPNGLQRIDDYAFADCSCLVGINIPDGLQVISHNVFEHWLIW